jgi:hypothetical protein
MRMLVAGLEISMLNFSLTILSSVILQAVTILNWKYCGEIWKLYTVGP